MTVVMAEIEKKISFCLNNPNIHPNFVCIGQKSNN
jgi:hypothetical protein